MENIFELLKNPPLKYRPAPFWSWNSKLDTGETRWQINEMYKAGMGGFFMHARGGLTTPYLGDEWMDNIKASNDEANKLGMYAWGYDENGWPSGFGADAVNGLGVEYQQKYLRYEFTDTPKETERTITNTVLPDGRNVHFYYDINPFYVDLLDPKVTDAFISSTHEKYKDHLGENFSLLKGFFTDEPQISRNGIPWSFVLEDEYRKHYKDELTSKLFDLFHETDSAILTRFRFWKLVTNLFNTNFMKKVYDWCNDNGVMLTGHMVCEETIHSQLECNGAVMPNYEYMHIPGIDKLGLFPDRYLLIPQVCSVAAQLGKKQILTESFACCGWDVSFEQLKHIFEWQAVKGVNFLCQHLAGYSLAGLRKRDYPAGHFYQNSWWKDYKDFNDYVSRIGLLLSEGEIKCDVLVLHNMSDGWIHNFGDDKKTPLDKIHHNLGSILTLLDKNQIPYHLGDDTIISRHGKIDGKKFIIGRMSYTTVIVPSSKIIDNNTFTLLKEFSDNGGRVIFVGNIPEYVDGIKCSDVKTYASIHIETSDNILDLLPESSKCCKICNENGNGVDIQACYREFEEFKMYYFVNTFSDKTNATITLDGNCVALYDAISGDIIHIDYENNDNKIKFEHTFEKMGSAIFFVRNDSLYPSAKKKTIESTSLNGLLRGLWQIKKCDDNVLTLDKCDLYFNGEHVRSNTYVCDVQQLACDLKKRVNIAMDFDVNFESKPLGKIQLVIETPEIFTIYINGKLVDKTVTGYYCDKSFKTIDLTGLFDTGYNILTLECSFKQSDEVYRTLDNCGEFESVRNKLYYDMEIEPIYLIGDFGVVSDMEFQSCPGNALKTFGKFSLTEKPEYVKDGEIVSQRFPFFNGSITLSKKFHLSPENTNGRFIEFSKLCGTVTKITVNGNKLQNMYWAPYKVNLDGLLTEGENEIEIEITTCFRNMLGPHYHGQNPSFCTPFSYHKESRIWGIPDIIKMWEDSYCFSEFGIFLK